LSIAQNKFIISAAVFLYRTYLINKNKAHHEPLCNCCHVTISSDID